MTPPKVAEGPTVRLRMALAVVELLPTVWLAAVAPPPVARPPTVVVCPDRSRVPLVAPRPRVIVPVPAAVALPRASVPLFTLIATENDPLAPLRVNVPPVVTVIVLVRAR